MADYQNDGYGKRGGLMNTIRNGLFSRMSKTAALNHGIIVKDINDRLVVRDPKLERLDAYYENRQYAKLLPFDNETDASGQAVPLRERKPRIVVPFAKALAGIVGSKLLGPTVFPSIKVEGFPDDQAFWKAIIQASRLQLFMLEPIRRMLNAGEIFVRFYISNGQFVKEVYDAKYCYPEFSAANELEAVTVKYIYEDPQDKDSRGNPKQKWFKLELGQQIEILYDNPEYKPGQPEPEFLPVETIEHGFGFVQGEWITTTGLPKGAGLCEDVLPFIDELCYSLSQSSKAVSFNQDPQLVFSKMTGEEQDEMLRSSSKSWNLGREGDAKFLESNMSGVQVGMEMRDKIKQHIQDFTRVILLDPEKIVGSAQSAKAMEVLHGPLKDLVDELRLPVGDAFLRLVMKMGAANVLSFERGEAAPIPMPAGFTLSTLALELKWPQIFQQTLEDLQKKVALASAAQMGGLIGPRTAVKYIAEDFGIEDVEQELVDILAHQEAVAAMNPFGGF